jgi:hypothetical protein
MNANQEFDAGTSGTTREGSMLRSRQMSALLAAVVLMAIAPAVSHAAVVSRYARFDLWDWVTRAIKALALN